MAQISTRRNSYLAEFALLPLRLFLGGTFVFAGLQKLANPGFLDANNPASIQNQLIGASLHSPIGALLGHLGEHAAPLGVVIALSELAIGVGTLLGLWARVAALGGVALSLGLFLSISFHASPFYTGSDIVFLFAWTPLVIAGAGTHLSLDAVIARRVASQKRTARPDLVALPFDTVTTLCGKFNKGRCAALKNADCSSENCPVLHGSGESLLERRSLNEVERRTLVLGALVAAGVAGASAVLAGASAAIGRAVGGVTTTKPTELTTTTTTPAGTTSSTSTTQGPTGHAIGAAKDVPVGGSANFVVPGSNDPGIVVQATAGNFVAYDAVCPHAGCTVGYYQASNQLICPCHTSVFNLNDGSLISGPAPTGLTKLAVTEANGTLYIESV